MRYYYKQDGQILGPLEVEELLEEVSDETLVRAEYGMPEYLPLYQTTILEDYKKLLPETEVKKPKGKNVLGITGFAGAVVFIFHLLHVSSVFDHTNPFFVGAPATSVTIIDSAIPQPYRDSLKKIIEADTLTRAEAIKLINESGR
ncbi:hypothetical protein CJD36_008735 [Flavipsychrobacter stenotrophus]|uniref:GYF domain-containing protein n=1 Tax=Flavipsychrobacter stenotrophus TaxID=2077091 RepID=A0A2S7SY56_9BACT|nr:hypothetical protein [Flavipsychrobacter stenotrophus]PQJ11870.1 hypothetical protein CJD36_008735 [Flavipsychrobacter stenotrophus]